MDREQKERQTRKTDRTLIYNEKENEKVRKKGKTKTDTLEKTF